MEKGEDQAHLGGGDISRPLVWVPNPLHELGGPELKRSMAPQQHYLE